MFFWIKVQVKACFFTVCQQSVHHDVIEDLQVLVGFERFEKIEKFERFEEFERFDGLDKSGSTLRFELKGLKVWELLHSTFLF